MSENEQLAALWDCADFKKRQDIFNAFFKENPNFPMTVEILDVCDPEIFDSVGIELNLVPVWADGAEAFVVENDGRYAERPLKVADNCLAGMRCPKCGFRAYLDVVAEKQFRVYDDGTEDKGSDTEWSSQSSCFCPNCGHESHVGDFRTEGENFQPIIEVTGGDRVCHTFHVPDGVSLETVLWQIRQLGCIKQ